MFKEKQILPLIGNEAIVLGALEAGVNFVATYPGTPSSEIGNLFYRLKETYPVYMEFSTNEKVALEAAAGAAFSGLKSLAAMKHFGLNVCLDALIPLCHCDLKGAMVIVVCDDPSCHSSAQSEEDSRGFWENLLVPILEPSNPEEARRFTKIAFKISEKFKKPVIIRSVTRVSHQTQPIKVGKIKVSQVKGKFKKDRESFDTMPPFILEKKRRLLALKEKFEEFLEKENLNPIIEGKEKKIGVIAAGASFCYLQEVLKKHQISLPILKIETFYPLPSKKLKKFLKGKEKVLVLEEVFGILEKNLKAFAFENQFSLKIEGKNLMEPVGELSPSRVKEALFKFLGKKLPQRKEKKEIFPKRSPKFCPGCPYWFIFGALEKAVNKKEVIFCGDIGCYMLGYFKPFEMQDTLLCMGSSVGLAHGISKATNQKVIALVGDSTFFHASLPGIINILHHHSSPLIIIFNNEITAMTGHQPHPGTPAEFKKEKLEVKIKKILEAIGFKNIESLDPVKEQEKLIQKIKEFLSKNEASAIICTHPCQILKKKFKK